MIPQGIGLGRGKAKVPVLSTREETLPHLIGRALTEMGKRRGGTESRRRRRSETWKKLDLFVTIDIA